LQYFTSSTLWFEGGDSETVLYTDYSNTIVLCMYGKELRWSVCCDPPVD